MHSLLGPSGQARSLRHPRDCPGSCSYAARPQLSLGLLARQRQRVVRVSASSKSLYEVLGVTDSANDRDIKRAYRQKALKLHPDVNKAPNAEAQFLEVKNAFTVLSDPQQRADYDRKSRGGFGSSWGSSTGFGGYGSWGSAAGSSSSSSSAGSRPRPKQPEEEFYGLEDFFNDLEKEVNAWSEKRGKSGQPASLWEELSAIGEELVDFLEQGLSDEYKSSSTERGKDGSSSGGSAEFNHSGKARTPVDKYEELKRRYDMYDESFKKGAAGGSSSSRSSSSSNNGTSRSSANASSSSSSKPQAGSSSQTKPPPTPQKTRDEEVEDELAALKRKLGKL